MNERERLDGYLDDFGERLRGASAPARRLWPRPLVPALCAGALAAVGVTIVLAAGGEQLDPVAEARAALSPPGDIVYMKITSTTSSPGAGTVPPPRTTEQWSMRNPLRWRFLETIPRPSARLGGMADAHGPMYGRRETSYAGGVQRVYLAKRDTMTVTTGYDDDDPAAKIPSMLGLGSGDAQADLRSMLFDGEVRDLGELQAGGRIARRFVSTIRRAGPNDPVMVLRLVYDVDPHTFAPIEARFSHAFPTIDRAPRVVLRLRVDEYKRIPLNEATGELLRIQTTPRTKATFDTAHKQRERARRWRAKCRPIQNGRGLACPPPSPPPRLPGTPKRP